jgi:hypothetical protein
MITTALLTGFSSFALAAPNFLYTVPLGTVSHYKTLNFNQTVFNDITVSNEDGSPVQKSIQDAVMTGFKNIDLTTTADITETVREVSADETRVVDALTDSNVEIKSGSLSLPKQNQKYTITTAYLANGQVQIQDLKFDRSSLPKNMTESVIESLEQDLKTSLSSLQPSVYGIAYEPNQPLFFEYKVQNTGFGTIDATASGSRTLTNIGEQGQLEFQIQTTTNAYSAKLELQALSEMVSEYEFQASSVNATEIYLPDGRLEHSRSKSVSNYTFKTGFKLLGQNIVISGSARSSLENRSDLIN